MEVSPNVRLALNDFFTSVERRAYFRVKLAIANASDAMDVVQDAMMKFVKIYAEKPAEEWPLLFNRVLETHIIDWHRRQNIRNRWRLWLGDVEARKDESDNEQTEALQATDQVPNQLELMMISRSIEELSEALSTLPLRQQQAFLLRVWEGQSVKETAATMGCSSGSVKTHFSRALKHLQSKITEYNYTT